MAEVGNMGLPPKLLKKGITDMVRISDARMSGTAYGTVVLHAVPEAALGGPLEVYRAFFLGGEPFIGGDAPSIADIRLAATLEFLRSIDYDFPAWAQEYMARMEATLGEAYSEPATDVRGYIAGLKSATA